jgi:D-alanine-D-alanine ligase-like ATP-grasp enzyme
MCLNKSYTKAQLAHRHVPTAPFQVFHRADEPIEVPLPAIVKPQAQDASIGIDRDSVVHDERALRQRVEYVLETYRQPALVEAFVVGREFNVGVLAAYQAMGCRDYARVDLRVAAADGVPYVLEVNPNPCLATDGGFANAARVAGFDHGQMAHRLAMWAWWRRSKHP